MARNGSAAGCARAWLLVTIQLRIIGNDAVTRQASTASGFGYRADDLFSAAAARMSFLKASSP
jgi:hypothetical protein